MNKRVLRLTNIVEKSKDFNSFMRAVNLDLNSCFLCLLNIIESAIIEYDYISDYSYLEKVLDYLKNIYPKLSIHNVKNNRKYLIKLKKILKKDMRAISEYDKEYFKKTYYTLEVLILYKKEKDDLIDINLEELLYEIIFRFNSLEYLDLLIDKNSKIVNSKYNNESIFMIVFREYLNDIVNGSLKSSFYIRVLYKFIHEDEFEFTNSMKEEVLNSLDDFINYKKISKERLEEIKDLYAIVKNQYVISNFKVNKSEYQMTDLDKSYLDSFGNNLNERQRINDYIITIDDDDSKVLDDAISISKLKNGNLLFQIHIADPLAVFPYKSDVIEEAKNRTTTIYLPNNVINMLPKTLSEDKLSLLEGKNRYAKTFCIEFNESEGIVDFRIINSIINVSKRYSYEDINLLYKNGGNKEEEYMLMYFDEVIVYLKKLFKNAKVYEEFKRSNVIGYRQKMNSFSENLICYSMLAVGYLTAKYFNNHKLPYAYRCHQFNEEWQHYLDTYINNSQEFKKMFKDIKDRFPKSYYSRDNVGHLGLKVEYYSHVTSPLRRFCDDLNMHAIDLCYFNTPKDKQIYKLEQEIDTTCDYINMQSNTIDEYVTKKLIK